MNLITNMTEDKFYSTFYSLGSITAIYRVIAIILTILFIILAVYNFRKFKMDSSNTKYKKLAIIFTVLTVIVWALFIVLYLVLTKFYQASFLFEANGI